MKLKSWDRVLANKKQTPRKTNREETAESGADVPGPADAAAARVREGPAGSTVLPAPTSNNLASVSSEAATVRELSKCLDLLETIRKMGSKTRVPVVLVYRERRHRTQHRHQEKGQSNKVVFAKEKRDFLSLLGLPGSMISEKGIDFSTAKKVLLQLLPFSKRKGSVSPHPKSELSEEEDDIPADARSTLSCDTCSSADSSETEEEVDVATDLAVLGATYAHKESVKPPPFRDSGSTYVSLDLEKIGIKNTRGVVCPFARVSVRDAQGGMVGAGSTQETSEWEVINKNYLRAPSQVHLQRPLEEMSEDVAIFIELRHYKPQKGVISTLCYTFLEKGDLKTGDFICELYSPPVDFSRRSLKTYTEKAFFLHLRVRLLKAEQDDLDLDSPRKP
ncbi:putative axin interactor, dorsalization-associated protein isoform X2 [Penaeus vannamei]|uniref:Putative axin interactor, dorsalization-associated protein isoform X2 n=1 Tax=Penaeus vannamei TaxID=6689 RepID=A0A423S9Y9_PENVA|nr:putative axin interactor, dorsalization-associated protein isoform X2 [Penaeus vannamei]